MKKISIESATVKEALSQVEIIEGVSRKDVGALRLLTEEMYSMITELLDVTKLNLGIEKTENKILISVSAKVWSDDKAKEEFLSLSTSGKNEAYKGMKGFFRAIVETMAGGGVPVHDYSVCTCGFGIVYPSYDVVDYNLPASVWTLSKYIDEAPEDSVNKEWDQLEKSIIANFADDIAISIYGGFVEMKITKFVD